MKKQRDFILAILLAILATPYAIQAAFEFRGYEAVGGEFLLIPLGIILVDLYRMVCTFFEERRKCKDEKERMSL